jgi:hypothetical protein
VQFEQMFREKFPATSELKFLDEGNPVTKFPGRKAEVLALTAILKFEHPTCLQANILLDKCDE